MSRGPYDAEHLLVDWLTAETGLTVSTKKPDDVEELGTHARVTRVGGTYIDPATKRIERARIDFNVWADTKPAAFDAAALIEIALADLEDANYSHVAGVVTATRRELGLTYIPDPETGRDRYLCTWAVIGHRV